MSGEIDNGGPAFPCEWRNGMTLRDYFAAKAMQAILANLLHGIQPQDCIRAAEDAYFLADRMLEARTAC